MGRRLLAGVAWGATAGAVASPAYARQVTASADATLATGISSNPFLTEDDGGASFYLEAILAPRITIASERDSSTIGGYVRTSVYLNGGNDPTWALGAYAQTQRAVSSRLTVRGGLNFNTSILGERYDRFALAEPVIAPVADNTGTAQDPAAPVVSLPPIQTSPLATPFLIDPDITLLGQRRRQTTFGGNAGGSYVLSARDTLSVDGQTQRTDNGGGLFSYTTYGGTVGYSRALSEQTQVGARVSGQWTDYQEGGSGRVYQPQVTLDTQLSPTLRLSGGLGLLFASTTTRLGKSSSTGLSATGRLCREGEKDSLCIAGTRDAGPNGLGGVSRRFSAGGTYNRRLSASETIRASVDYAHVSDDSQVLARDSYSYVSAIAGYDRRIGQRLSVGVNGSYRDSIGGIGRPSDLSGSVYVTTRLGALR